MATKEAKEDLVIKIKPIKKQKLRNYEYYNSQEALDKLYKNSKNGKNFKNLMELICEDNNIKLAYRAIKNNKGSYTPGVNGHTIEHWKDKSVNELTTYIKRRLGNYRPQAVKRVMIPKPNGNLRPLGIPTIEDRLIQQCIKQILEPICEAKFYRESYGFRPNRSTEHAINTFARYINTSKCYYIVDVDIKGFFDNVNHGKLLKQMWSLGIRDKNLLCVISKMLKAEIEGEGIPTKGTPQGGILSPLLSNIVLNELDWWIASQWCNIPTRYKYLCVKKNGQADASSKYKALRKTELKEGYIVRYADDFKIACKTYEDAKRYYIAVQEWLKDRLELEISTEKSKVTNIKKANTEFLGFRFKAVPKRNKFVAYSHMSDKSVEKVTNAIRDRIKDIQKRPTLENISKYNSTVLGIQNYYKIATHINTDMSIIAYKISFMQHNRLGKIASTRGKLDDTFKRLYKNNHKRMYIKGIALFPIQDVQTRKALGFKQSICDYTEEGRILIHEHLSTVNMKVVHYLMENPSPNFGIEFNDNKISLYIAQKGICYVSKEALKIGHMECHHKNPVSRGGDDSYKNLVYLTTEVHKLVHATNKDTIKKYKEIIGDNLDYERLNKLRKLVGNEELVS
ncbi:group II intron reverse transcriptase/maturase [Clostridioides difficile]|nr:group II intron reverse transcriptase/maturase [Clostridioides difficile]MDV9722379.1 group II intron reverse transcriptase/maturase [Clostridioides difficile]